MRSVGVLVLFALGTACGKRAPDAVTCDPTEAVAAPRVDRPAATRAGGAAPATMDAPAAAAAPAREPVGHLQGRERLGHLFEAFARIDRGDPTGRVRIVQYGDSHTASDLGVSVFRRELQARFGDGGRGFVSIGKPWKFYGQSGVHGTMTDGFEPVKVKFHAGAFEGVDGSFGLLGVGIEATGAGERASTDLADPSTRVELDCWRDPTSGSFDVFVDGAPVGRVATRADAPQSGFWAFGVTDAPHQIEIRTVGDGDVRVFGMSLDRGQGGVVVDALGINGAQVFTALRWNEAHFAEQLRHRAPDLVVLAYGTNEAVEPSLTDAAYEHGVVDMLGRVARATPGASCLLLGPPDLARRASDRPTGRQAGDEGWTTTARVLEIVEMQRRIAQAAGCAFYDQLAAMGGPGSIAAWAAEAEPRALRDRVHLSRAGYAQVGTSFADDLLRAYDQWRGEHGLPPANAPKTWGVAIR